MQCRWFSEGRQTGPTAAKGFTDCLYPIMHGGCTRMKKSRSHWTHVNVEKPSKLKKRYSCHVAFVRLGKPKYSLFLHNSPEQRRKDIADVPKFCEFMAPCHMSKETRYLFGLNHRPGFPRCHWTLQRECSTAKCPGMIPPVPTARSTRSPSIFQRFEEFSSLPRCSSPCPR